MANPVGIDSTPPSAGAAWVAPDGRVLLSVRSGAEHDVAGVYWFITDADGEVRTAMLAGVSSRCTRAFPSIFAGRYTLTIYEDSSAFGGGFLASEIDDLRPRLAIHLSERDAHDIYAGPFSILDLNKGFKIEQYSWKDGSPLPLLWSPAQDNGLQQGSFVFANDAMFWSAGNSDYHKLNVYSPDAGVRDFLSAGLVIDHGYDDLGTDGHDLVWIEARGRKTGYLTPFDTYDIMTAPYTADPAKLAPRRVRSAEGPLGLSPFVVGCGYAARQNGTVLRIVRLSDGQSWLFDVAYGTPWSWATPRALTCDELFIDVLVEGRGQFARIRLDSLGPGLPAD
jgi:hypothetical protein